MVQSSTRSSGRKVIQGALSLKVLSGFPGFPPGRWGMLQRERVRVNRSWSSSVTRNKRNRKQARRRKAARSQPLFDALVGRKIPWLVGGLGGGVFDKLAAEENSPDKSQRGGSDCVTLWSPESEAAQVAAKEQESPPEQKLPLAGDERLKSGVGQILEPAVESGPVWI